MARHTPHLALALTLALAALGLAQESAPDPRAREILALADDHGPEALARLRAALAEPALAEVAAGTLAARGGADAADVVLALLADERAGVRRQIAWGLAGHPAGLESLGPARAGDLLTALGRRLTRGDEYSVCAPVLELLERAGPAARPAGGALVATLSAKPDVDLRLRIAHALIAVGLDPEEVPALLAAARDPDRGEAAVALVRVAGRDAAVVALLRERAAVDAPDPSASVARAGLALLGPTPAFGADDVISLLEAGPAARALAHDAVAAQGEALRTAIVTELEARLADSGREDRYLAAEALAALRATSAAPALLQAVDDQDDLLGASCVDALATLGVSTPQVVDRLLIRAAHRVEEEPSLVATAAVVALGCLRAPAAVPVLSRLADALRARGGLPFREAEALARIGGQAAHDALAALGAPGRPLVPDRVSWAVGVAIAGAPGADLDRAIATLVEALESPPGRTFAREVAAEALAVLGPRAAVARPALRRAAALERGDVANLARLAVVSLAAPARR